MLEIKSYTKDDLPIEKIHNINRISHKQLTYNDFFYTYMRQNWPVIITDISKHWDCQQNWIITTAGNVKTLNLEYLKLKIPNVNVPVANCQKEYSNSHEKFEMKFYDFLEYWHNEKRTDNSQIYYLKDWHLQKQIPEYEFYQNPIYFGSDWLNEYLLESAGGEDDYKFVYMGPKGSWYSILILFKKFLLNE